jgi:hypothetical protein
MRRCTVVDWRGSEGVRRSVLAGQEARQSFLTKGLTEPMAEGF